MRLLSEQEELREFETTQEEKRIKIKAQEISGRFPNLRPESIERLAKTMLSLDRISDNDEFDSPDRTSTRKEKLLSRKLEEPLQVQQDNRVEALCMLIDNEHPTIRQKNVNKTTNTTDPDSIDYRNPENYFRTKLHQAVYDGLKCEVIQLVRAGANTDVKDGSGYTPFQLAIREENLAIAEYLKDK